MRYRLMATYRGSPFEAGIGPTDGDIVLFAACPPPEDLGFEPATGHWRKQLPISEVQAVWESRPVGTFRGERCMVLDDLGDRLHIGYLGHDGYQAERLGYWQVDRGVFELVAARSEVSDIVEERSEYPTPAAAAPAPASDTAPAPASDTAPQASYSPQDQARYLPPEAQEQASYLLDRTDYFRISGPARYQQDSLPGYAQAGPASGQHSWPDPAGTGQHPSGPIPGWSAAPDPGGPETGSGIGLPGFAQPPLPLEAAALRAATASRPWPEAAPPDAAEPDADGDELPDAGAVAAEAGAAESPAVTAAVGAAQAADIDPAVADALTAAPAALLAEPGPGPDAAQPPGPEPETDHAAPAASAGPLTAAEPADPQRRRRPARRRLATERVFAELASLAGIPVDSYAIGEEVEGALCLLQTEQGFEVFHSADGNRHELQYFGSEEAACFYLFGVLAAEAVRNGTLLSAAGHITGQLPAVRLAP